MSDHPSSLKIIINLNNRDNKALKLYECLQDHIAKSIQEWMVENYTDRMSYCTSDDDSEISDGTFCDEGVEYFSDFLFFENRDGDCSYATVSFHEIV